MPVTPGDDLTILPLTRERIADLSTLFDAGGDPKWCWCAFFRVRGLSFANSTPAANRAVIEALADDSPAPGLVAYKDGALVGWVSLGPREGYERLTYSRVLAPLDDTPVWSIVCFVVARQQRGRGIAKHLLAAAIEYARQHGATMLEAYPADTSDGRIPSADAYRGPLPMFERAGFEVVARRKGNADSRPRPIVRLAL
jgi:GNAT superfamily N-acetyltransferase